MSGVDGGVVINRHRERILEKAAKHGFVMCASAFPGHLPPGEVFPGSDFEPEQRPRSRMDTVDQMIAAGFLEPTDAFNQYRLTPAAKDLLRKKAEARAERAAKRATRSAAP